MSIFKGHVNARYEVQEKDFMQAMLAMGFECSLQKKGSRRHFTPMGEAAEQWGRTTYVYHLHGKLLEKTKQDLIAKDLRQLYGWCAETFVLAGVAIEEDVVAEDIVQA
ncbi:hypothetical protein K466DRAFT_604557 [Polyporus arcularius HHB13444]|uniref:Uncharacterized protein n=1 Tax=Polyporus arcularius HHB13444 TaxID=1314778 RepID=A0A5C3NVP0_9APHY|nr:hypothetical protein K466DRAFT_604557 [Polyporus arcularius HHB13444]